MVTQLVGGGSSTRASLRSAVKELPAMQEDMSLIPQAKLRRAWKHSSILAWELHGRSSLAGYSPGVSKVAKCQTVEHACNCTIFHLAILIDEYP